jgi:hypothetical protein
LIGLEAAVGDFAGNIFSKMTNYIANQPLKVPNYNDFGQNDPLKVPNY